MAAISLLLRKTKKNMWGKPCTIFSARAVVPSPLASLVLYVYLAFIIWFVFFRLYVNWRFMRGIEAQFLALQKGFSELIPQHLLKPFDHKELEVHVLSVNRNVYLEWTEEAKHKTKLYLSWSTTLSLILLSLCQLIIGGLGKIDLADWKTNTRLKHCTSESNVVRWFWQAVEAFSEERRGRLLQFVTGSTRVPLQGFKALQGGSWTGIDTTHTYSYTH